MSALPPKSGHWLSACCYTHDETVRCYFGRPQHKKWRAGQIAAPLTVHLHHTSAAMPPTGVACAFFCISRTEHRPDPKRTSSFLIDQQIYLRHIATGYERLHGGGEHGSP